MAVQLSRRLNQFNRLISSSASLNLVSNKLRQLSGAARSHRYSDGGSQLTPSQVSTALRPFFFAVHPDRFWTTPAERQVNENSLKQLNEYLEMKKNTSGPSKDVRFYLKNSSKFPSSKVVSNNMTLIQIKLFNEDDMNETVERILSSCKLSTEYLDRIGKKPRTIVDVSNVSKSRKFTGYKGTQDAFWMKKNVNEFKEKYESASWMSFDDLEDAVRSVPQETLIQFLKKNAEIARQRSDSSKEAREEIAKLKIEVQLRSKATDILWNSDWNPLHARGALSSLNRLLIQHHGSEFLNHLTGKTIIFNSNKTGINFDGSVLLSTEDVRQNWLRLFNNIQSADALVEQIPFYEMYLSSILFNIKISHRKFNSIILVQSYLNQLIKLSGSITKYHRVMHGQPSSGDLSKYKLVVESESGPLMLSPTGQFIAPSSCPASLLLDFLTANLVQADQLLKLYHDNKKKEEELVAKSLSDLNLLSLEKDDNVTPDLMNACLERLLDEKNEIRSLLNRARIRVSKYYSVQESGEICIPWNFVL